MVAEIDFSLLSEDIIHKLSDREFFVRAVAYNYNLIGIRSGCEFTISKRRSGEAFDYWREDINRTLKDGIEQTTTELDHFKHASFIAFWLRRMNPINETRVVAPWNSEPDPGQFKRRKRVLRYGNELCALLIGYQLCLIYEATQRVKSEAGGNVFSLPNRLSYIKSLRFPDSLIDDYVMILKHKNMSPYSLYLLYKSLFFPALAGPKEGV